MKHEEIRSYEVSIWTLQDEFITVLKWSNIEHKGTILDPKFTSIDDGTLNFSFTIPMYIRHEGQLIENPLWYNTLNGNLIANLKKIKIIFNKNTADEEVVELLITKVTEEHEQDHVFCNIECEGLAFNELGKIGYTYDISSADLEYDYLQWLEKGAWFKPDGTQVTTNPPVGNILYWCEKIGLAPLPASESDVDPRKWYYYIDMNWDSFSDGRTRNKHKMYEEPYEAGWSYDENTGKVISHTIVETREKERTIEVKESNIYNITLTIAETFGVFCRYKYYHDNNYHITKKVIIFFNNYLYDLNIMSFTYPYSSKKVTREMDSSAVTTKLYVRSQEDTTTLLGEANIRYCEANKMQEDYILNFDYLKESGNMTLELYDAVSEYEDAIHRVNAALYPVENKINVYENEVNDLKAKQVYYTNAIELDKEQITLNSDLALSLTVSDGLADLYISSFNNQHPDYTIITTDELDKYCIKLNTKVKGIRADSVKIYRNYASSTNTLSTPLDKFYFVYDEEYGFPTRIYGESIAPTSNSYAVYMTYDYEPRLYYDAIVKTWEERLATDEKNLADITKQLSNDPENGGDENAPLGVELALEEAREELQELIQQKKDIMAEFNYDMGPALREGYWQPEKYIDYGERYLLERSLSTSYDSTFVSASTGNLYSVGWDTNLLDNEQDIYYEISINLNKVYYPCVNLTSFLSDSTFLENLDKYSFIFYNNYYDNLVTLPNVKYIRSFSIGSEAILGFVKNSAGNIFPALILVGAKNMTTDDSIVEGGGTIGFMLDSTRGLPRLGMLTTTVSGNTITATETQVTELDSEDYFKFGTDTIDQCVAVMPRLKFSSLMLKTSEDTLFVRYNNTLLKNYYDYYITNRQIQSEVYAPEYFITIKPFTLIKTGVLNGTFNTSYVLSNASTAIYLDALEVAEENSKPKVSYTVDPNILDRNLTRILYEKLNWVVMINDVLLKFNNVFGYISKLELDLDFPDKDAIEVKNYVTKFEDLFSTIVAQTEAMKLSSGVMGTVMAGDMPLSDEGLSLTLDNAQDMFEEYLDDYIDSSDRVREKLMSLFTEAGSILASTSRSMRDVNSLTAENAEILGGFVLNINKELTPLIYKSNTKPSTYKLGDVWILTDDAGNVIGEYVATSSSGLFAADTETSGFARTFDGTLASITGASLDINADDGNIALLAKNNIEIKSGGYLYLASENVDIVGNKCVNIGGAQINIVSLTKGSTTYLNGGINLIAGSYSALGNYGSTSRVLLRNDSIEMGAATLTFKAASSIDMIASTGDFANSSAIKIGAETGIWIGTGKSITLFSGRDTTGASGSSVLINTERILMGVTNTNDSSVFDLTPSYLVMGVGTTANNFDLKDVPLNLTSGLITGMKLTKDSFGLAVGTGAINNSNNEPVRTVILANSEGFIVGAGITPKTSGSYVEITGGGIDIGSLGTLTVDTSNFKVLPNATGTNPLFYVGTGGVTTSDKYIKYSVTNGLEIRGKITANELYIVENNLDTSATDWVNAKVTPEAIWLGVVKHTTGNDNATVGASTSLSLTDSAFTVSSTGSFTVNSGTVSITSDNVIINTDAGANESIFKLSNGDTNNPVNYFNLSFNSSNLLFAQIGGWLIEEHKLSSGTTDSAYVALDSDYLNGLYAMWAGKVTPDDTFTGTSVTVDGTSYNVVSSRGAPFRVTRNGRVYMDKLMLWDSENHIYKEIDFSDFKQAVAITLECSGTQITARASYWGKFSTHADAAANASSSAAVAGSYSWSVVETTITVSTDAGNLIFEHVPIDISTIVSNNQSDLVTKIANATKYDGGNQFKSDFVASINSQNGQVTGFTGTQHTISADVAVNSSHVYGQAKVGNTVVATSSNAADITAELSMSVDGNTVSATAYAKINGTRVDSSSSSRTVSSGSSGNGNCFAGGTPILLTDGTTVPIEKLQLNTKVLAYNLENQEYVPSEVLIVLRITSRPMEVIDIYLSSGTIITATTSHPILTTRGWCAGNVKIARTEHNDVEIIDDLHEGDQVFSPNYENIFIEKIVRREDLDNIPVYHIDVEPTDTYVAGGIVVHNDDTPLPK